MLIKGSEIRKLIREELTRSMLREGVDNNIYDILVQKLKNSIDKKNYWEDIDTLLATFLDSVPEELKNTISGSSVESIKTGWSTEASKIKSIGGASVSFSNDAAGLLKFVKSIKRMMDVMDVKAFQAYIKMSDAQQTGKWDDATDTALKAYLEKMKNSKKDIGLAGSSFDDILKNGWKSESGKITSLGGKEVKYTDNLEGLMSFVKDVEAVDRPMYSGTDYKYGEEVPRKLTSESTIRRIVRETLARAMMREGDPPSAETAAQMVPHDKKGVTALSVKEIQKIVGVPETGIWDKSLDGSIASWIVSKKNDPSRFYIESMTADKLPNGQLINPERNTYSLEDVILLGWKTVAPTIVTVNGRKVGDSKFKPTASDFARFLKDLSKPATKMPSLHLDDDEEEEITP